MDELPRHIAQAATQGQQLGERLSGRCWPGGGQDRFSAVAARWLAGWQPQRLGAELPRCSCASGRCGICN